MASRAPCMEEVRPAIWRLPFSRSKMAVNGKSAGWAKTNIGRQADLTPPVAETPAMPTLPPFMEQILVHAESDYQDALRILLLQMVDLHKLYEEDPGNYLALHNSAVAAVRKFPGMESGGMAEKMIYALEQSVRGNLEQAEYDSELAKWFHTLVKSEEFAQKKETFSAGTTLIRQGDCGTRAYLVISGRVRVFSADAQGVVRERAVVKSVGLVGEFRLLYNTPASASVVALEDVETIAIDQEELRQVLESNTGLRYWIIQEANQRLRPLLEERMGKACIETLLSAIVARENLAQFKDEMLAALFIMVNTVHDARPKACVAALGNVYNLYSKIVNSNCSTKLYTFQPGLPELDTMEPQTLDIMGIFDGAGTDLEQAAAQKIRDVLRFKGACYLLGDAGNHALKVMQQTGLTHFDLGMNLHAFVKATPSVAMVAQ